ncbi:MAG: pyrroline-5-carboxylate reductase [Verrucomicrobia bacterium]|nr:pyrroline-5-carboxylate reductase [Verrucomicrobiota bacterium]
MKLVILGAGRMGGTILRMLVRVPGAKWKVEVCEPDAKGREALAKETGRGVKFVAKADELGEPEAVLLAVKPAMLEETGVWLRGRRESYLLISILAGVTTEKLAKEAGPKARVVRAMPNQALRQDEGVTAVCAGPGATKDDLEAARKIFAFGGHVMEVEEEQMDVVTALSGSGPAFLAKWAEELAAAAARAGLTAAVADELVARTMLGTAAILVREKIKPGELCAAVASPGGTTEAGLKVMQAGGTSELAEKVVRAAVQRARELGRRG